MSLSPEVHYEYYFRNAVIYYCKEHNCLRITDDHEDSVLLNGVTEQNIDTFIQFYNINVKDKKKDEDNTTFHMDKSFEEADKEL